MLQIKQKKGITKRTGTMAHRRKVAFQVQRMMIPILVLSLGMTARTCAESLSSIYTTPQDYSLEHNAGSIAGLFCALLDNPNPYVCENEAWVSYGVDLGMNMGLCGTCVKITNTAAGGGSVKACILDQKQAGGLDLDLPAFQQIDNPARDGNFNGHMVTDVEFVDCS